MQNVRQRILQIIQERGQATVADLAEALGMAPVSVRHHLDILQGDGLIRVDGVRRRSGAGRPQHVYSLTPEALEVFPKNYDGLLDHVLSELEESWSPEQLEAFLRRIARRMAAEFVRDGGEPSSLESLLDQVVAFLSEKGYMAHWERRNGEYAITLANCPYAGLIDTHTQLCRLDEYLIQYLTMGSSVPRAETTIREGRFRCRVIIPAPAPVPQPHS